MSPRLPRDVSGSELAKLLAAFGYVVTRQRARIFGSRRRAGASIT